MSTCSVRCSQYYFALSAAGPSDNISRIWHKHFPIVSIAETGFDCLFPQWASLSPNRLLIPNNRVTSYIFSQRILPRGLKRIRNGQPTSGTVCRLYSPANWVCVMSIFSSKLGMCGVYILQQTQYVWCCDYMRLGFDSFMCSVLCSFSFSAFGEIDRVN